MGRVTLTRGGDCCRLDLPAQLNSLHATSILGHPFAATAARILGGAAKKLALHQVAG
jgi:hypothetical protein